MTNCFGCKWQKLRESEAMRKRAGVSLDAIDEKCRLCVEEFRAICTKKPMTCYRCAWKDRNLPYERRQWHCKACVEEFVKSEHTCTACPWNDREHPMPTDAAMAHCKACLAKVDGDGAKNCASCAWANTPAAVKAKHCAACSLKFASNKKVVGSTNELSNKGQTITSYDNHNAEMTDDRDTVTKLRSDYVETLKSDSKPGMPHPVFDVADRCGMSVAEFAQNAYDLQKRFLYELSALSDMQALLFLSTVRGEAKTEFARHHNLTDTAVNQLFKQVLVRSDIFKKFILLSRGTLAGTRGRKSSRDPNDIRVSLKTKKIIYCGATQMSFAL